MCDGIIDAPSKDGSGLDPVHQDFHKGLRIRLLGKVDGFVHFPEVNDRLTRNDYDHVGFLYSYLARRVFKIQWSVEHDIGVVALRYRNLDLRPEFWILFVPPRRLSSYCHTPTLSSFALSASITQHTLLLSDSTQVTSVRIGKYLLHMHRDDNSGRLRIYEHSTDTAGFTDQVFALCHLLASLRSPQARLRRQTTLCVVGKPSQWRLFSTNRRHHQYKCL